MKLWLFPVPVGSEVDSPTGVLHQLRFHFQPTDGCLLQRRINKRRIRDRRDFYFRSRYFRFRPGVNPGLSVWISVLTITLE